MYVVMRPPGCYDPNEAPYQGIELGDSYQQFLLKVWDIVSQHPKLKNNTGVMFELANEPVKIKGTDVLMAVRTMGIFRIFNSISKL